MKTTAFHWGGYHAKQSANGEIALLAFDDDRRPADIGSSMFDTRAGETRLGSPLIRRGWLENRPHDAVKGRGRGSDDYVAVPWEEAVELVTDELRRVIGSFGNKAIFGGSYGWGSAGRFHHPQSQLHRFLNVLGGYVSHRGSYSLAAIEHIIPYVIGLEWKQFTASQTCWNTISGHTDLLVCFGGMPGKNAQVSPGGTGRHRVPEYLQRVVARGAKLINIAPDERNIDAGLNADWLAIRPGTDTALMLALAYEVITSESHDRSFLSTYCVGYERLESYILGRTDGVRKSPLWAQAITDVPESRITALAKAMTASRTMITMSWSIQRTQFGEQPIWMGIALAAVLGQIGLPGGGFGIAYGGVNYVGGPVAPIAWASLPQGVNPVSDHIPVARISDMLLNPDAPYEYDGLTRTYPDIRLVYWAGGNPFHHHQDLNRLVKAWQRPETVIVHDFHHNALARHADIVLPAAMPFERNDFAAAAREDRVTAMHRLLPPYQEARSDFEIFRLLAARLGVEEAFTEDRDEMAWVQHLYEQSANAALHHAVTLPPFEQFWADGRIDLPECDPIVLMEAFRADPLQNPLPTPSGKVELFSEKVASYHYGDCPGHPTWLEPMEWLGSDAATSGAFHLVSPQPAMKLHSQCDHGPISQAAKTDGREVLTLNPQDAAEIGIAEGEVVEVYNDRGCTHAVASLSSGIRRRVASLPTGTWFDPVEPTKIDRNGNPNVLTRDVGTSRLSQGTTAMTCLVWIRKSSS